MFVFAFCFTRRNASHSGEGKKECEEKTVCVSCLFPYATLVQYPYCFHAVNKKRARRRVGDTLNIKDYSSSTSSTKLASFTDVAARRASPLCCSLLSCRSSLLINSLIAVYISSCLPLATRTPLGVLIVASATNPCGSLDRMICGLIRCVCHFSSLARRSATCWRDGRSNFHLFAGNVHCHKFYLLSSRLGEFSIPFLMSKCVMKNLIILSLFVNESFL